MTRENLARIKRSRETNPSPKAARPQPIVVGLVNNMPDAALGATEAQFRRLIDGAAGQTPVELKLFFIPEVVRSDATRADVEARYAGVDTLAASGVDALIVTGAEPRAATLEAEPYWERLSALVDWARTGTVSTLWSCLAAHAAVLRLDGITRQPLAEKCSGVFPLERVLAHPLTLGGVEPLMTPHSRVNGLDEADLRRAGYRVLTRSADIGVDAFIREEPSLFVFLQGHPEYDPQSLMLEYRRDVGRFLRQEQSAYPTLPTGYFDKETEGRLTILADSARRLPARSALAEGVKIMRAVAPADRWGPWSAQLFGNWLRLIEAQTQRRAAAIA